jgi:hypothetical protein
MILRLDSHSSLFTLHSRRDDGNSPFRPSSKFLVVEKQTTNYSILLPSPIAYCLLRCHCLSPQGFEYQQLVLDEQESIVFMQHVTMEQPNELLEKILRMDQPPLPVPKQPSKCPLFCCFYAEFDIKVGPMICFQSPRNFMDQEISSISLLEIQDILAATFCNFEQREKNAAAGLATGDADKTGLSKSEEAEGDFKTATDSGLSIFDSTSEYIITGNELTGKIVTLSTHDMHIMTRPTLISDERYERNSLLFSVGIVLRRAADPGPFRPLISKLALTLRTMEVESQFLSNPSLRSNHLQPLLERVLVSLNSSQWECNLLLSRSNSLNLKLFHPPKPEASVVHDHQVPILLRKDIQLQMVRSFTYRGEAQD